MKAAWDIWRHGAYVAVAYALGALAGFMMLAVPVIAVVLLLELVGVQVDDRLVNDVLIYGLAIVWLPLGLGFAARHLSTERLKPDGYQEPEGRYARIARRITGR